MTPPQGGRPRLPSLPVSELSLAGFSSVVGRLLPSAPLPLARPSQGRPTWFPSIPLSASLPFRYCKREYDPVPGIDASCGRAHFLNRIDEKLSRRAAICQNLDFPMYGAGAMGLQCETIRPDTGSPWRAVSVRVGILIANMSSLLLFLFRAAHRRRSFLRIPSLPVQQCLPHHSF